MKDLENCEIHEQFSQPLAAAPVSALLCQKWFVLSSFGFLLHGLQDAFIPTGSREAVSADNGM